MTIYMVEVWDSMLFPVYPVAFAIEDTEAAALNTAERLAGDYAAKGGTVTDWKVETVYDWKG